MDPAATSAGLFWLSTGGTPFLINQDFNAALYGGTDLSSLPLLTTVLLSNGTGIGDNPSPGIFLEPAFKTYTIQGALNSAFFRIEAWTGNFDSYAEAIAAGVPAARSPVFENSLGVPPADPSSLTGMPGMVIAIPEPSTFALVGLGCLLVLRRAIRAGGQRSRKFVRETVIATLSDGEIGEFGPLEFEEKEKTSRSDPRVLSDFDTLGLDGNGLYLSVLHTPTNSPSTNAGHSVVAIKKPDIYLGTNIFAFPTNNLDLWLKARQI